MRQRLFLLQCAPAEQALANFSKKPQLMLAKCLVVDARTTGQWRPTCGGSRPTSCSDIPQ
jgi:hypothetical protein